MNGCFGCLFSIIAFPFMVLDELLKTTKKRWK